MRILHSIARFDPVIGGPAEAIRNIIIAYNKIGIQAEVVCIDDPNSSFLNEKKFPFDVHALGHVDEFWCFSPKLIPWLRANIDRFDIVIIHGLWLYPSYAVNSVIQELKTKARGTGTAKKVPPFLIFPHGMLDPYFQRSTQRRLKAIRNWLYWKLVESQVVNVANAMLFTCETELLLARQTFQPYQPRHEINVGYGIIDPPRFSSAMVNAFLEKCPQVTGRPYLLFLSRINYKKGLDLLINAYAAIVEARLKVKQQLPMLVIAGPGLDTAYGEFIKQLVRKYPFIEDMIYFTGMLTGDAKWGAIFRCEAFLLPSHQENFGIVVAEALACGKPVLISNQVNIWREIEQEGSGIVGHDSLEDTQRIIEQWLAMSRAEQQEMTRNARKTYEKYFQIEQVIYRLNNVFELVNSATPDPGVNVNLNIT